MLTATVDDDLALDGCTVVAINVRFACAASKALARMVDRDGRRVSKQSLTFVARTAVIGSQIKIWNLKNLIMETRPSGKIEAQGLGIAAVSDKLLQQRAQDLAEEDGRTGATNADRAHALGELSGPIANPAPEVPPGDENLTVWNQSPDVRGHLVPNVLPDDEADISAELTKEGMEEADQDRRRASKDEDPPRPD